MAHNQTKMYKNAKLFEGLKREMETQFTLARVHQEGTNRFQGNRVVATILKNYFSLGYYTAVMPFKTVYNPDDGTWRLESVSIQKVICCLLWAIYWFIALTDSLNTFKDAFRSKNSLTAKAYFKMLNNINCYIIILLSLNIILKKRKSLENCLNQAVVLDCIELKVVKRFKIYVFALYLFMFVLSTLPAVFTTSIYGDALKSPTEAFRDYIIKARHRFFMDNAFTEFTTGNVLLGLLEFAGRLCFTQVLWTVTVFFTGPMPVIMWLIVKDFETYTEQVFSTTGRNKNWTKLWEIKTKYEAVKTFSGLVNNIWSVVALVWILDTILRAMMILNQLVSSRSIASLISVVTWTVSIVMVLILSGETYRKMECFKAKLLEEKNFEMVYAQDKPLLKRLLKELDDIPVGIGATGLYNLNYGFTAQLLVASLTIFLVSFEKE